MLEDESHRQLPSQEARQLVLSRLNTLYEEALAAWETSKQPVCRTRILFDPVTNVAYEKVTTTEVRPSGDPRLLGQALQAMAALRAVLGLDAPSLSATAQVVSITQEETGGAPIALDLEPPRTQESGGGHVALEADKEGT
jgi:hypothetical protein